MRPVSLSIAALSLIGMSYCQLSHMAQDMNTFLNDQSLGQGNLGVSFLFEKEGAKFYIGSKNSTVTLYPMFQYDLTAITGPNCKSCPRKNYDQASSNSSGFFEAVQND